MPPAHVSLVVTTYNWPDALAAVLESIRAQVRVPDEVIVADDGSTSETAHLVRASAKGFPCPVRHLWQEDLGFRVARARNRAISAARSDYVLLLDGDMVLHRQFVADHLAAARPNHFVQGSRVLVPDVLATRMLRQPGLRPGFLTAGLGRRRHTLRAPVLAKAYSRLRSGEPRMIKTCNQGWWRSDLLRLNGFDERMQGWGREDDELALRAWHAGIACRQLRLAGVAFHLHHARRHDGGASANDIYLAQTRATRATRCTDGLQAHLDDLVLRPPPDLRNAALAE